LKIAIQRCDRKVIEILIELENENFNQYLAEIIDTSGKSRLETLLMDGEPDIIAAFALCKEPVLNQIV
jgi:hypothetical protein